MQTFILFALLASIVGTSAVPHKRECPRKGEVAPSAGPSNGAVVAIGQSHGHGRNGTRGGHRGGGGGRRSRSASVQGQAGPTLVTSAVPPNVTNTNDVDNDDGQGGPNGNQGNVDANPPQPITSAKPIIPSTSQAAPSPSDAAPTGGVVAIVDGGGSGSAGLAINEQSVRSFSGFLDGKLDWYTGWALTPLKGTTGLEWVPQVHGLPSVAGVAEAAKSWTGVKYVLGFNEPDMTAAVGGSDIPAGIAATKHQEWVKALGGSYQIGAPGVARGGQKWLSDWVAACAGNCKYDFVPFHYYGTDPNDLIKYAKDFHATFGKPLWVTEWSCIDYGTGYICNEAEVKAFMKTAIDWFRGEGKDIVHRWAYFGAFADMASGGNPNGLQGPDGSANAMGKYYISL